MVRGLAGRRRDLHNFAQPLLASSGTCPQNIGHKNPTVDRLISQAVSTPDGSARDALYQRTGRIGFDDVAEVPIDQGVAYTVQRDWVQGRVNNPVFGGDSYDTTSKGGGNE